MIWTPAKVTFDQGNDSYRLGSIAADFEGHVYINAADFKGRIGDYEVFEVLGNGSFGERETALPATYGNLWGGFDF